MFFSYVLVDTVAIEAVYSPHNFTPAFRAASTRGDRVKREHDTKPKNSIATPSHNSDSNSGDDHAPYELTLRDILLHRLTERYVGRVIPSRGLCVAITDVMDYSASAVRGAAASAWLTATFGVCVFAPAAGTRLKARIAHQSNAGIYLTLDLFVAIPFLVPAAMLVPGSRYSAAQRSWYLPLDGTAGEGEGEGGVTVEGNDAERERAMRAQSSDITCSSSTREDGQPSDAVDGQHGSSTGAMASPAVPHNKYVVGAEVMVKVVACTVLSEETMPPGEDVGSGGGGASVASCATLPSVAGGSECGLGGGEGPVALMELRGSFIGDALGPVSWF